MKIAFDARMAFHSGIGTHIRGLLRAMNQMHNPPDLLLLGDLHRLIRYDFHQNFKVEIFDAPVYSPWQQYQFPRSWPGADALHVPHYNIPYRYDDPLLVTIHDLIHLLFPEQLNSIMKKWYAQYTFRKVAQQARTIISVSEHTKKDILERLGVEDERVTVIPNAVRHDFQPTADPAVLKRFREQYHLPSEYLLAVGIDKPHKNFDFLLKALAPLWDDGTLDLPLVFVGVDTQTGSVRKTIQALGVEARCLSCPWIDNQEMPLVYQSASLLVFPSLYEGFGLPVLEAQRVGLPVVASNAASIPEVGGSHGALYFDPTDRDACRQAMTAALKDSQLRESLIRAGRENEQRYSWERSAEMLVRVYKGLSPYR